MQSYDCKQVPVGVLHTDKMAEVALLKVFRIGFPAYLFSSKFHFLYITTQYKKYDSIRIE